MNNQQLAILLTQYLRQFETAFELVREHLVEAIHPVLEPMYVVQRWMREDIEKLEHSMLVSENGHIYNPENEPAPESPRKGKEVITFEGDHICVNGANLGVHDLLMYARACLKREAGKDVQVARIKVALEDVIEGNQLNRGVEEGARMPTLANGEEV
jgi:hypothetical protein